MEHLKLFEEFDGEQHTEFDALDTTRYIANSKPELKQLTIEELKELLEKGERVIFISIQGTGPEQARDDKAEVIKAGSKEMTQFGKDASKANTTVIVADEHGLTSIPEVLRDKCFLCLVDEIPETLKKRLDLFYMA